MTVVYIYVCIYFMYIVVVIVVSVVACRLRLAENVGKPGRRRGSCRSAAEAPRRGTRQKKRHEKIIIIKKKQRLLEINIGVVTCRPAPTT